MDPYETAQEGLEHLKQAVISLLGSHPQSLRNAEIADKLGIRSHQSGHQRNFLSFSVLGLLIESRDVIKADKVCKLRPSNKP